MSPRWVCSHIGRIHGDLNWHPFSWTPPGGETLLVARRRPYSDSMTDHSYSRDVTPDFSSQAAVHSERTRLVLDLQDKLSKLNDQARIFIPLIALCLIVAMPIWSKSLVRFLMLLLSPFVLLPLGFCIIHLVLAYRGIARTKSRIRDLERSVEHLKGLK